jgi:hypothetical protein
MSVSENDPTVRKVRARGRMKMEDFTLRYISERYELDQGELALEVRVYRVIEAQPGIGLGRLRKAVSGGSGAIDATVQDLARKGAIVDRGDSGSHAYHTRQLENVVRGRQGSGKGVGKPEVAALSALGQSESRNGQGFRQAHLAAPPKGGDGGKVLGWGPEDEYDEPARGDAWEPEEPS